MEATRNHKEPQGTNRNLRVAKASWPGVVPWFLVPFAPVAFFSLFCTRGTVHVVQISWVAGARVKNGPLFWRGDTKAARTELHRELAYTRATLGHRSGNESQHPINIHAEWGGGGRGEKGEVRESQGQSVIKNHAMLRTGASLEVATRKLAVEPRVI